MLDKTSRVDGELGLMRTASDDSRSIVSHSPSPESSGGGQRLCANQMAPNSLLSPDELIAEIRYWHRQRCFAMEQRKRVDLALGSFLRLMLGWSKDKPEAERSKIAKRSADIIKNPTGTEWESVVLASSAARAPFEAIESQAKKQMAELAQRLPVWGKFGEPIRGFGAVSLAVIIAETGDLSNYSTHSKLWKRMGLAVMDGIRQGGLFKGASAEDWIAHGYNPVRRAHMWCIGDALIKGNRDGRYRTSYLDRKGYEVARDTDIAPIKAHRRAQRYMEKRLLKDLWRAWRVGRTLPAEEALYLVPHAINSVECV